MITTTLVALTLLSNPKPFPFSYTYPTVPKGHLEVEQYVDMVPVRVERENDDGTIEGIMSMRFALQTELEIGITDRLELGIYMAFQQGGGNQAFQFRGLKQRLRYRLFEAGELPVDIALYGEIAEYFNEFEFEEKILLSRRFGPMVVALNLWVEQEYYFDADEWKFIYNPTLGASYELSPNISVGLEGWVRGRFDKGSDNAVTSGPLAGQAHVFVGPVLLAQLGEYWTSIGAYVRMDGLGDPVLVGDFYGPVYIRAIFGAGL